ncbi:hypothetical protein BH23ACT8_BH23ACT8_25930 [soil metagenome]
MERDLPPEWLQGTELQVQLDLHQPILEAVRRRDAHGMATAVRAHHEAVLGHLACC